MFNNNESDLSSSVHQFQESKQRLMDGGLLFQEQSTVVRTFTSHTNPALSDNVSEICTSQVLAQMMLLFDDGTLKTVDTKDERVVRVQQLLVPKGCDLRARGTATTANAPLPGESNKSAVLSSSGAEKARQYGRRLLKWSQRAKANMLCVSKPGETVLAVNHTAFDRSICFHDTTR